MVGKLLDAKGKKELYDSNDKIILLKQEEISDDNGNVIFDENGEIKVEYTLLENLSENGKVKVKKGEKVNVVPKVIAAGKPLSKHDAVFLENFGLKYKWNVG